MALHDQYDDVHSDNYTAYGDESLGVLSEPVLFLARGSQDSSVAAVGIDVGSSRCALLQRGHFEARAIVADIDLEAARDGIGQFADRGVEALAVARFADVHKSDVHQINEQQLHHHHYHHHRHQQHHHHYSLEISIIVIIVIKHRCLHHQVHILNIKTLKLFTY